MTTVIDDEAENENGSRIVKPADLTVKAIDNASEKMRERTQTEVQSVSMHKDLHCR
jgi:hypothetical protein